MWVQARPLAMPYRVPASAVVHWQLQRAWPVWQQGEGEGDPTRVLVLVLLLVRTALL